MLGVLGGFVVVGAVILVGYVAGRLVIGGPQAGFALNQVAFFVTNPALLFTVLADAHLGSVFSEYLPVALISSLAIAALYVVLSRFLFRRPAGETAIGAMASSYVNANNIGIPIIVYALGDATLIAPVLLVQLLLLAPLYLTILDLTSSRKPSVRAVLTQPFRNPMIIASLLGVVVSALPTAQNVFMFAGRYGRGIPLARDTVLLSSALAIPALVVVAALLA